MAQYSKPIASITQNQTRQRRGTSTKTAVQIWLFTAFLGTVLGTASEIFHLIPWLNTLPQQLGTIVRYPTGQTKLSPQPSLSPLAAHPTPTITPTPTMTPTPSLTPTLTQVSLGSTAGNPTVNNAGFEIPALGYGGYQYSPTGSYWIFSNNAGIAANDSPLTNNHANAPQGTQVAFLQGTGSFSQKINFPAGSYHILFYAAQRNKNIQNFQVLIDGHVIGIFILGSLKYKLHSTNSFTITAGKHVLCFQGLNSNGENNMAFIDAVAIK